MYANMSESRVNRMIGKRQLIAFVMLAALTVFSVFNFGTVRLSAYESPAIYISPAYVSNHEDPYGAFGTNYTLSILTDYDGSDVWGYEFELTYDPNLLQGAGVVNGDLITEDNGTIQWQAGTFNNTAGTLSLTGNGFYYVTTPPLVSGPGILANVTFTVVGYGISNITFVENKTRLIGFTYNEVLEEWEEYNIIDEYFPSMGHIEGSVFDNTFGPVDINKDGMIDIVDIVIVALAFGSKPGDPKWNPLADVAPTYGLIDIVDIVKVALRFGEGPPK